MDSEVKDYLIALLKVAREEKVEVDATKIQKIFFLLEREKGVNLNLDFKPWLFGPYSKKLDKVLYGLIDKGVIKVIDKGVIDDPFTGFVIGHKRAYELNGDYEVKIDKDILDFFRQWVVKDRKEIVGYIYSKYEEFTDLEKIRESVFGSK